jgi:hypothetical protein
MTSDQLAAMLKKQIQAHGGAAYPAVHLFGIEFAEELEGQDVKAICAAVGLSPNYATEVSKGRRLAPYVSLRS